MKTTNRKTVEKKDLDAIVRKQLLQKEFNTKKDSLSALYSLAKK